MPVRPEFTWNEFRQMWEKNVQKSDGKYTKLRAPTKNELKRLVSDFEIARNNETKVKESPTVEAVALKWLQINEEDLSVYGKNALNNTVKNHIIPSLGKFLIKEVTPEHIDNMMLLLSGKSNSLHSKVLSTCKRIFKYAKKNKYIVEDPTIDKKSKGKKPKEEIPLTDRQAEELLSAVTGTRAYLFCLIALYTGMRKEEILGLTWDNVHFEGSYDYIEVKQAVVFDGNEPVIVDFGKTPAAMRKIPIPKVLSNELKKEQPEGFLLHRANGEPYNRSYFSSLWNTVQNRIINPAITSHARVKRTLDFSVHPHQLRHTYITNLCMHSAETGLDIKTIQYLAGHADPQITLKIYSHVMNGKDADTANKIQNVFKTK